MSYFAFGLAELTPEAASAHVRASVCLAMARCADAAGLGLALGGEGEPRILDEMRGDFLAQSAIRFLCVGRRGEDTSDSLISPHVVGLVGAVEGAGRIAAWLKCVLDTAPVERVKIWFVEGFDDAFERADCRVDDLTVLLSKRIRQEQEIPSMLLTILPSERGASGEE